MQAVLKLAQQAQASDVHLQPVEHGLEWKWRIDGVLQRLGTFPLEAAPNIVARLKVLAGLLTYRTDTPQEGRIRPASATETAAGEPEMRVCTFPTLYGERAVVRFFAQSGRFSDLQSLGLPAELQADLARLLRQTSGAILIAGPAGSGKTTTLYACLRAMAADEDTPRCLMSIEDPIESSVAGVSQSQVNSAAGFTLESGLKSLLRQDPEVLMVGEIRDPATAALAIQASLSGHQLLTSLHAGSAAGAVSRLLDMGLEPYQLQSGLLAILAQRLLRRLCECCLPSDSPADQLGLPVEKCWLPVGCSQCLGTGYQGRFMLAEMLIPGTTALGRAILSRADTSTLHQLAVQNGMAPHWKRACEAVSTGLTSPAEVRRVLGFEHHSSPASA